MVFRQVKKGKIQYDTVMKSLETLMPDELYDDTKRALELCKTSAVGIKDPCEASYTLLTCLVKENPKFYFP